MKLVRIKEIKYSVVDLIPIGPDNPHKILPPFHCGSYFHLWRADSFVILDLKTASF